MRMGNSDDEPQWSDRTVPELLGRSRIRRSDSTFGERGDKPEIVYRPSLCDSQEPRTSEFSLGGWQWKAEQHEPHPPDGTAAAPLLTSSSLLARLEEMWIEAFDMASASS